MSEGELEMVQRHVREGERHLAHQRQMVDWLADRRCATDEAERLLANFEDLQRLHCDHLAALRDRGRS